MAKQSASKRGIPKEFSSFFFPLKNSLICQWTRMVDGLQDGFQIVSSGDIYAYVYQLYPTLSWSLYLTEARACDFLG